MESLENNRKRRESFGFARTMVFYRKSQIIEKSVREESVWDGRNPGIQAGGAK